MKLIKRLLFTVAIVICLTLVGIFAYLQYLNPDLEARVKIPGLQSEVEVLYDSYGVPHIYAGNEEDLFYAFGYIHAQDRLFQMEILRRLADGRLSEVFGEKALNSDRFFRSLQFREHAKWTLDTLYRDTTLPMVKASRAYLKGINHYIASGKTPIEFTLAGIPKTPFTAEDAEIIIGYMGYTFVGTFKTEPIASTVLSKLGKSYYYDIMSQWPDTAHRIPVRTVHTDSTIKVLAELSSFVGQIETNLPYPPFHGSNGWLISGRKTKSGKPILSNDTHIEFAQPSVWYEAHLNCPGLNIYGNFIAGVPFPALGHNDRGGWGLTMFENDDADLYREKLNPSNPQQVWYKDHWEDISIRKETIRVKGKPDEILELKRSRHGYFMNDVLPDAKGINDPIAFWWVYHQFPSYHIKALYEMIHATDVSTAGRAISQLTSPGLNFMWADVQGNIAWWAAGKIPIRPAHVDPQVMLDGASGNDDPTGWLDFSQNPQILNPERGVLYTANNQPADMGTGLVAGYYVPADRAERIEELLFTDKKDWTEEDTRNMINDVQVTGYVRLLKKILPVIPKDELTNDALKAYDVLLAWDGKHELENIEPTIFYRLMYQVSKDVFDDELGPEAADLLKKSYAFKRNINSLLKNDSSRWWDDVHTRAAETRSMILAASLNKTAAWLMTDLGSDMSQWQWKKVHTLEHKHPLGIVPVIGKYFNVGPIPVPGGRETLNNLAFELDSTGRYMVKSGPALRRNIDFSTPEKAYSVLPTGQSGYFMSKHYDDQAKLFAEGGKRPEWMSKKDIEKHLSGRTLLKP